MEDAENKHSLIRHAVFDDVSGFEDGHDHLAVFGPPRVRSTDKGEFAKKFKSNFDRSGNRGSHRGMPIGEKFGETTSVGQRGG
jgi:hypothetical protein